MRLTTAAGLGAAAGLGFALPIAGLLWISTSAAALRLAGFDAGVAEQLAPIAQETWAGVVQRSGATGFDQPLAWLLAAASVCALVGIVLWAVDRRWPLDPGRLAWRSLQWTLANLATGRLLAIVLAGGLLLWSLVEIRVPGFKGFSLLGGFIVLMLLATWQVQQPAVVRDDRLGPWWRWRRPSLRHLGWLAIVWPAGWLISQIPFLGDFVVEPLVGAAVAHIVLSPPAGLGLRRGGDHWWSPLRPSRWLVGQVWFIALLLPVLGLIAACMVFNVWLAHIAIDLSQRATASMPPWWPPFSAASQAFTRYWWVALPLIVYLIGLAYSGRLAWLEISQAAESNRRQSEP